MKTAAQRFVKLAIDPSKLSVFCLLSTLVFVYSSHYIEKGNLILNNFELILIVSSTYHPHLPYGPKITVNYHAPALKDSSVGTEIAEIIPTDSFKKRISNAALNRFFGIKLFSA